MPKRRMTSRRRAQIKAWQLAGARARKTVVPEYGSFSDPHLGREKLGWSPRKQRTIKYMGKAALKHSSEGSVTIAPWARQALAGEKPTAPRLMPDPSTIRGDMVIKDGSAYRLPRPKPINGKSIAGRNKIAVADKLGMSVADAQKKMTADSRKIKAAQKAADKKKYAAAKAAYQKSAMGKKYK